MVCEIDLKKARKIGTATGELRSYGITPALWFGSFSYVAGETIDPAVKINNNGQFTFNRTDSYSLPNVFSGFGTYTSNNINAVTLTGVNTMTGKVEINLGKIIVDKTLGTPLITFGSSISSGKSVPLVLQFDCNVSSTQKIPSIAILPYTLGFNAYADIILNAGASLPSGVPVLDTTFFLAGSIPPRIYSKNTCGHIGGQDIKCTIIDKGSTITSVKSGVIFDGSLSPLKVQFGGDNNTTANNFPGIATINGNVTTSGTSNLANTNSNQDLGFRNNRISLGTPATVWTITNGSEYCAGLTGPGATVMNCGLVSNANNVGLTIDFPFITGGFSYNGILSGNFNIRKLGAGTQIFNGNNSYKDTYIDAGIMKAGHINAFGTGTIYVAAGATLQKGGFAIPNQIVNNGGTVTP